MKKILSLFLAFLFAVSGISIAYAEKTDAKLYATYGDGMLLDLCRGGCAVRLALEGVAVRLDRGLAVLGYLLGTSAKAICPGRVST